MITTSIYFLSQTVSVPLAGNGKGRADAKGQTVDIIPWFSGLSASHQPSVIKMVQIRTVSGPVPAMKEST